MYDVVDFCITLQKITIFVLSWFSNTINMVLFIIIVIVVVFIALLFISIDIDKKKSKEFMEKNNLSFSDFYPVGKYIGGHPKVDNEQGNLYFIFKDGVFSFYNIAVANLSAPVLINGFDIAASDINDITIEDSSSVEHKVTLGRFILVGVFSALWKKKVKNELAFLVIEWKKGKFSHDTIFVFEEDNAFIKANTARNKLISFCETDIVPVRNVESEQNI